MTEEDAFIIAYSHFDLKVIFFYRAIFSMENIIEADTLFVIVEFPEKNGDNMPLIDLVPQSWISIHGGEYFCCYPEKITAKISKWVKTQKEPSADWDEYPVIRIVNQASMNQNLYYN